MIKRETGARVVGVEVDSALAAEAARKIDEVVLADIEEWCDRGGWTAFDLVLCADVLEHLRDPGAALIKIRRMLRGDGRLVVSIPNARNWFLFHMVFVRGDFQYRDRGLFDRTHLRFFTRKSLCRLLRETGYEVERTMAVMQAHAATRLRRLFVRCANLLLPREFSAFQWLVVARPASADAQA